MCLKQLAYFEKKMGDVSSYLNFSFKNDNLSKNAFISFLFHFVFVFGGHHCCVVLT